MAWPGKKTIYSGRIGEIISLTIEEDGDPVDLTDSTVTLKLYSIGSNTLAWSHECTVDDASNGLAHYTSVDGDFDTAGWYYSLVSIVYDSGNSRTEAGPTFEVIENEKSEVLPKELLRFMRIPEENAADEKSIEDYLEMAEMQVNTDFPSLADSDDPDWIISKKYLMKLKASILYFMNSDESTVNPNARNEKIKMWTTLYNQQRDEVLGKVSSDSESGSGFVRRVKSSDYSDPSHHDYISE